MEEHHKTTMQQTNPKKESYDIMRQAMQLASQAKFPWMKLVFIWYSPIHWQIILEEFLETKEKKNFLPWLPKILKNAETSYKA